MTSSSWLQAQLLQLSAQPPLLIPTCMRSAPRSLRLLSSVHSGLHPLPGGPQLDLLLELLWSSQERSATPKQHTAIPKASEAPWPRPAPPVKRRTVRSTAGVHSEPAVRWNATKYLDQRPGPSMPLLEEQQQRSPSPQLTPEAESKPESEPRPAAVPEREQTPYREPTPCVSGDSDNSSSDELNLIDQEEAQLVSAGLDYVYTVKPEIFHLPEALERAFLVCALKTSAPSAEPRDTC